MRFSRFLAITAILIFSGCWESPTISSSEIPEPFRPWDGVRYDDKIILQSSASAIGPIWLLPGGLWGQPRSDNNYSSVSFGSIRNLYGTTLNLRGWNIPWIDSDVWIDARHSEPTLLFATYPQGNPKSIFKNNEKHFLHIPDCSNIPKEKFRNADSLMYNPVGYGAILRSSRYAFFNIESLNGGLLLVRMATSPGIHLVPNKGGYADCKDLDSGATEDAFATKWIPLHRATTSPSNIQITTVRSATSINAGAFVYYDLFVYIGYGDSLNKGAKGTLSGQFLSFIDTLGNETILDSSVRIQDSTSKIIAQTSTRYNYINLTTFQDIAYAFTNEGLVRLGVVPSDIHYQGRIQSAPTAYFPKCYEVNGMCVLIGLDSLWALDPTTAREMPLDNQGLKTNKITGVVQHKDTVYVSTLSGVFTKPVSRFFEPAK